MFRSKIFLGSLVAATSLSAFLLTSTTVSAENVTRSARIQVASACTMDGAVTNPHNASVTPGTYTDNIGTTVFSVVCNDAAGFGVYAIGYTDNFDGNAVMQGDGNNTIATGTATSGNTSNWAMKLATIDGTVAPTIMNGYDDYSIVPSADYVKVASYPSATSASSSAVFKSSYAAYVTLTQPSGTYTGQVKYVLVHPANGEAPEKDLDPFTTTFDEAYAAAGKRKDTTSNKYKMQDMTSAICNAVTDEQTTTLVDTRDGTIYNVVKALDHRCWLADNLALDLTATNASTNITTTNTNADTDSLKALFGTVTRDTSTDPNGNLATAGVTTWTSGRSYSAPMIYTALKDNSNSSDNIEIIRNSKYGIYYNYCAASAGSYCYGNGTSYGTSYDKPNTAIDVEYDICPSGWRMPTGDSYDATDRPDGGEYQALYTAYNNNGTNLRSALLLPLSGRVYNGSVYDQSSEGYFWSSTRCEGSSMYYLYADSSSVDPQWADDSRNEGLPVRCVAR